MKTTPLYSCHINSGAQMTEFAGYQMPVRYQGDKIEHMAVRQEAGIFDVSHMGEIWVKGPNASKIIDELLHQDTHKYSQGRAFYGLLLNSENGIVDDIVAYKFTEYEFLICVNAANRQKDYNWILSQVENKEGVEIKDESDEWCQIAIQGPGAVSILADYLGKEVLEIKRFRFRQLGELIVARTGYTGEDGFEIFVPNKKAVLLWEGLAKRAIPCGLAARDTLRLEAGMRLYGQDMNEQTTPWEAGLDWCVVGLEPLSSSKRLLIGLIMQGMGIARPGYEVFNASEEVIGIVTSGTKTPYLNRAIAMAYIDFPYCEVGQEVFVKIRDRLESAKITALPFYRREK